MKTVIGNATLYHGTKVTSTLPANGSKRWQIKVISSLTKKRKGTPDMAMLPKEQILANRLGIAMHDWTEEGRRNMIEWVTDALKEQRYQERQLCADIAREHSCRTWSECCDCGGEIARAIMQPRTED